MRKPPGGHRIAPRRGPGSAPPRERDRKSVVRSSGRRLTESLESRMAGVSFAHEPSPSTPNHCGTRQASKVGVAAAGCNH